MNDKGNRYAIAALRDKRATISAEIVQLERQLRHKRENLVHVDATLAILDPGISPESIPNKRIPKHINLFRTGELSRLVLSAFREAETDLSTREIVDFVMRKHGVPEEARGAIAPRVRTSLAYQERREKVEKIGKGTGARWRLE